MLTVIILDFILLVLRQTNVVVIVIILMILTQKKCVPDVVKDLNVKVFNLMSRTNETRHMKWHKTCKYECRLDSIVCNNKQRWNKNKYPRFVHVFIEKKNSIKSVSGWSMYL